VPKKELTDEMLKEMINNLPPPLKEYLIENCDKPFDSLQSYSKGFRDGANYVSETLVKPYLERVDKILSPRS
jgi:hypothetical protein